MEGESQSVPCLLVVDPEAEVHKLVRLMLKGHGIRVCSAFRGHDAVQWLLCDRVNVILFGMFGPYGIRRQAWDVLAAQGVPGVIPTILSSKMNREEGQDLARELGVRCFLRKPFRKKALLEAVASCLERVI